MRIEKVFKIINKLWKYMISETEGTKRLPKIRLWGSCAYLRLFLIPSEGGLISADRLLLLVIFFHILYLNEYLTPFDIPHNTFWPF
ncbi:hypothetical protein ASG66_21795 [Bacillus sp. Leaf406]|nr:hypothetical protein ASG66_21795 [Bacillus sp. Leaf406]